MWCFMSQGIHHTNKWLHASVGSLKTFDMVFSNKFLFWFDTFVQTFCVLLAGLLFLVSCAGRYWITFNVTMNMILIMMIIMTQVLPSRCTRCLGNRLLREAARPTDQIGWDTFQQDRCLNQNINGNHAKKFLTLAFGWFEPPFSPQVHPSLLHSSLW